MNFFDDQTTTTGQFLEKYFPGRPDVVRLLMEPITYANGSTLEDPALTYGIVFSNFMSKGVYTFQGGTDRLIGLMRDDLLKHGVDIRTSCKAEKIHAAGRSVQGVSAGGRMIKCRSVVSNANLTGTIFNLAGPENFDADFIEQARAVRLNNSSTQVYIALKPGEMIDEETCGDLLFSSTAAEFRTDLLLKPEYHQPDIFVLLSQDPAGHRPLLRGGQHKRELPRLGRPEPGRLPGGQTRFDREHA